MSPAPQGPPSGDDSPQEPQGPPGQDQGGGGGGEVEKLIGNVGGALQHLQQVFQGSQGVPPDAKNLIGQIVQLYGQLMKSLQGGGEAAEGSAQGQTVSMEAGGNKGAVPSPM